MSTGLSAGSQNIQHYRMPSHEGKAFLSSSLAHNLTQWIHRRVWRRVIRESQSSEYAVNCCFKTRSCAADILQLL